MTYTLLNQFRLPEDLSLRLGNIDLMNKCAEYKEAVLKLNRGMSAWQGLNQQLQQSVISNFNLPPAIIHANRKHIQDQAEALNKFLIGLSEDMKVLLAYTRIYLRKDKHILSVWLLKYNNKDQPIISEEEINAEMKILESEIEEISKKSRDRISKILEK